jgi:putative polyhydroxyalkanoate system protein
MRRLVTEPAVSQLVIRRLHSLPHADVQARVAHVAHKVSERFGAACRWDGDVLWIEHASVNGTVTISDREVVVDARLGLAFSLFRGRAEQEIARLLDRELGVHA